MLPSMTRFKIVEVSENLLPREVGSFGEGRGSSHKEDRCGDRGADV